MAITLLVMVLFLKIVPPVGITIIVTVIRIDEVVTILKMDMKIQESIASNKEEGFAEERIKEKIQWLEDWAN